MGCLHTGTFLLPRCLVARSSDGLTISLPRKHDIFLDSLMVNRSRSSQEKHSFSILSEEGAIGAYSWFYVWSRVHDSRRSSLAWWIAEQSAVHKLQSRKSRWPSKASLLKWEVPLGVSCVSWFGCVSDGVCLMETTGQETHTSSHNSNVHIPWCASSWRQVLAFLYYFMNVIYYRVHIYKNSSPIKLN